MQKLRVIFQKNGYPNLFIKDAINKFKKLKANTKEKEKCKKKFYLQLAYHILEKSLIKFSHGLNC